MVSNWDIDRTQNFMSCSSVSCDVTSFSLSLPFLPQNVAVLEVNFHYLPQKFQSPFGSEVNSSSSPSSWSELGGNDVDALKEFM